MPLNCFGKKKGKKKFREPPPSVNELDKRAVRDSTGEWDYTYIPEPVGQTTGPPPLPSRQNVDASNSDIQSNNNSPKSPRPPLSDRKQSDGSVKVTGNSFMGGRQLSSKILSTPVPIGNKANATSVKPKPEIVLEREDSEDYLDPCGTESMASPPPMAAPNSPKTKKSPKLVVSLSEDKKNDILSDYFQPHSLTGLNVVVPPTTDPGLPQHDYSNVSEIEQINAVHSAANGKADTEGYVKSPRRPRPMPRQTLGSERSGVSESDDTEFAYENVTEVLQGMSDVASSEAHGKYNTCTPKPHPRSKPSLDKTSSLDLPRALPNPEPSTNGGVRMSPLQQRALKKDGYVYDADYVKPDSNSGDSQENISTAPYNDSRTLPSKGSLDLLATVPKAGVAQPGLLVNSHKSYMPMDQSPLSQAVVGNGHSFELPNKTSTANLLSQKIPVPTGNSNDVHFKGYLTVLSDPVPPPTKKTSPYYNLTTMPDYLNTQTSQYTALDNSGSD